jgi:hypothetical protein
MKPSLDTGNAQFSSLKPQGPSDDVDRGISSEVARFFIAGVAKTWAG